MKLSQKGELQLLRDIQKRFSTSQKFKDGGIIVGIGDDAAVFSCLPGQILVTTDMMNEGIHFDLSYTSASHLGFKLVSANVSDIYAMGGKPKYLFLNIAFRKNTTEEFFWEFFSGLSLANNLYGLKLLGGDTTSISHEISVSATVIGYAERVIRRSGAKIGDKVYITNTVGDSAGGLEILKKLSLRGRKLIKSHGFGIIKKDKKDQKWLFLNNLDTKNIKILFHKTELLLRKHLLPVVRSYEEINRMASSMIDISDGLFIDLVRICDQSNVGVKIYKNKIPISDSLKYVCSVLNIDPYKLATSGGEDYEFLFTSSAELKVEPSKDFKITCIGEIIPNERIVICPDGTEKPLYTQGYQHFSN
ncbi:MAG: thiamine-phosphate kinase [Thermodesulfovibrionales bacterium]|nr:thiamine-phosphate kinase [Thermodesulfovibrionales bacterium]